MFTLADVSSRPVCVQLSYGLSTEYSKQPQASNQEKVDADRDKYAKFYVHQILSMGEEGIRDAYRRVSAFRRQPIGSMLGPDSDTPALDVTLLFEA